MPIAPMGVDRSGFDSSLGRDSSLEAPTTSPTFVTIASSTAMSTSFAVFATILSQPSAATRPLGVPSPVSWMRRIHAVRSSFSSPSASTSVPLIAPPFAWMRVEKPPRVEEVELVGRGERLVDGLLGQLAAAPERPEVAQRHPADERLGREPVLEGVVIDVARDERVVHDALDLLVVVAEGRLDAADAPGGDDRAAHVVGQVLEDAIGARSSRRAGRSS